MPNNTKRDDWHTLHESFDDPWLVLICGLCVMGFVAVLGWAVIWAVRVAW